MPLRTLFEKSLNCQPDEHIGLIYDAAFSPIASSIIDYCSERDMKLDSHRFEYDGTSPLPEDIRLLFLERTPEVLIVALLSNIWHTPERWSAKHELGKRIANIIHPSEPCSSYLADISRMSRIGRPLEQLLLESTEIHITSPAGTDLTARIGKVFCETGDYRAPGSGGDFPAGEVGFGPQEGSVNGRLVYDFKVQHLGRVKDYPVVLMVKDDVVVTDFARRDFLPLLQRHDILRFVSEISIGINDVWTEVDEDSSIVEEKNFGTVHFGHGSNLSYGTRRGPHFDAVILNPSIVVDNRCIMSDGVFNEKYIKFDRS